MVFAGLPRLYTLCLEGNLLTGEIPPFDQPSLRYLNLSNNNLSGEIPATEALAHFNHSSFLHNPNLCGPQIKLPCSGKLIFPPSTSPESPISSTTNAFPPHIASNQKKSSRKRLLAIVAGSIAGVLFLSTCLALAVCLMLRKKRQRVAGGSRTRGVGMDKSLEEGEGGRGGGEEGGGTSGGGTKGGFSWEGEGLGKLMFCGGVGEMYSLEELLKASAETLGRGTVGSTYKAVMESGFIVTVKRLKDSARPGVEDFQRGMEDLGRLRHPNLVFENLIGPTCSTRARTSARVDLNPRTRAERVRGFLSCARSRVTRAIARDARDAGRTRIAARVHFPFSFYFFFIYLFLLYLGLGEGAINTPFLLSFFTTKNPEKLLKNSLLLSQSSGEKYLLLSSFWLFYFSVYSYFAGASPIGFVLASSETY